MCFEIVICRLQHSFFVNTSEMLVSLLINESVTMMRYFIPIKLLHIRAATLSCILTSVFLLYRVYVTFFFNMLWRVLFIVHIMSYHFKYSSVNHFGSFKHLFQLLLCFLLLGVGILNSLNEYYWSVCVVGTEKVVYISYNTNIF